MQSLRPTTTQFQPARRYGSTKLGSIKQPQIGNKLPGAKFPVSNKLPKPGPKFPVGAKLPKPKFPVGNKLPKPGPKFPIGPKLPKPDGPKFPIGPKLPKPPGPKFPIGPKLPKPPGPKFPIGPKLPKPPGPKFPIGPKLPKPPGPKFPIGPKLPKPPGFLFPKAPPKLAPIPPLPIPPKKPWCGWKPNYCWWWFDYCLPLQICKPQQFVYCDWNVVHCDYIVGGQVLVAQASWYLGVKGMILPGKGLGVESVDPDSPADFVGLMPGMVIEQVNGVDLVDEKALAAVIKHSNGILKMRVVMQGSEDRHEATVVMQRVAKVAY